MIIVSNPSKNMVATAVNSSGNPVPGQKSLPNDSTMKRLGRSVSFTVPSDGDYFIEIKNTAQKDIPYRLTTHIVTAANLPCDGTGIDAEPNNTPLSAGVLTSNDTNLHSGLKLCKHNDDWYALSNLNLAKFKLTVAGVRPHIASGKLKVVVYNSNWELLPEPSVDPQNPDDYIVTLPSAGTYIVGLRPTATFDSDVTYSLKLTSPIP